MAFRASEYLSQFAHAARWLLLFVIGWVTYKSVAAGQCSCIGKLPAWALTEWSQELLSGPTLDLPERSSQEAEQQRQSAKRVDKMIHRLPSSQGQGQAEVRSGTGQGCGQGQY
jgi:hypothetical protein